MLSLCMPWDVALVKPFLDNASPPLRVHVWRHTYVGVWVCAYNVKHFVYVFTVCIIYESISFGWSVYGFIFLLGFYNDWKRYGYRWREKENRWAVAACISRYCGDIGCVDKYKPRNEGKGNRNRRFAVLREERRDHKNCISKLLENDRQFISRE